MGHKSPSFPPRVHLKFISFGFASYGSFLLITPKNLTNARLAFYHQSTESALTF